MSDTRFCFLVTGDPQIGSDRDLGCLARNVEFLADTGGTGGQSNGDDRGQHDARGGAHETAM